MRNKTAYLMILLMICTVFAVAGCSSQNATKAFREPAYDTKAATTSANKTIVVSDGPLTELQFETITLEPGQVAINHITIRNAYETTKVFKLQNTGSTNLAEFPTPEVTIAAGESEQIKFNIRAENNRGIFEQSIKVTDDKNNVYAVKRVKVMIGE